MEWWRLASASFPSVGPSSVSSVSYSSGFSHHLLFTYRLPLNDSVQRRPNASWESCLTGGGAAVPRHLSTGLHNLEGMHAAKTKRMRIRVALMAFISIAANLFSQII